MAGSAGTTATTSMPTGAENFIAAILGTYSGSPTTGTVLAANLSAAGGNPYEGVSAFNADENFEPVMDQIQAMQDSLSVTSWSAAVDEANTKAESLIGSVDIDNLFNSVVSAAIATASSAIVAAFNDAVSENAGLIASASEAATPLAQNATGPILSNQLAVEAEATRQLENTASLASTTATSYSNTAASRISNLISTSDTTTLAIAEQLLQRATQGGVGSLLQQMLGVSATAKAAFQESAEAVVPDSIIHNAYAISKMGALDCIDMALVAARNAVDRTIITEAVTAYRKEALKTHIRSVNSFTGPMADINAVNSSAFVLGMAMMESDFTASVNKFQADLELQLFRDAFTGFLQNAVQNINGYLSIYQSQMQTYTANQSTQLQAVLGVVSEFVRAYVSGFAEYLQAYSREGTGDVNLFQAISQTKSSLSAAFADIQSRAFMQHLEKGVDGTFNLLSAKMQNLQSLFQPYFETSIKEALDLRQQRTAFVTQHSQIAHQYDLADFELNKAAASLMADTARIRSVLSAEEYVKNLEYDVRSGTWDLELFQMGANIMSAYSGSVVTNVGKPSQAQSVMGGVAAGASIGSTLGVPGAIAGALIGGIGGLIQ